VNVILEKTNTGYSAYIPDIDGCITVGNTLEETKKNMFDAIDSLIEVYNEDGITLPEILQAEYELNFKIDFETYFEWMQGIMSKAQIAKISGIDRALISQYANKKLVPSQKQLLRIEESLHNFGRELLSISF
jgi:predicted RNase H-like HicB family nuclease